MTILLRNAHLVDPETNLDATGSVLIDGEKIAAVTADAAQASADRVVDCTGLIVSPGWIDMHVHLRVPGQEYKETIATGTAAAAAGGFTAVACMPNTEPALDSVETLRRLAEICDREAIVPVHPIGAITIGRAGQTVVDFDALAEAGVVGFSDDGISTANARLMVEALRASARLHLPVMVHCEDPTLVGGSMNDGEVSRRLGIAGIPAAAEEAFIARDCLLAAETGGWLHVLHVSTGRGLDLIRLARRWGAQITCEVMPHHLVMSDEWVAGSRRLHNTGERGPDAPARQSDTKVNPPLRTERDTQLLLAGLVDGTFDILATDHAPHADFEKHGTTIDKAMSGMIGLEVAVPTMFALVRAGHLTITNLVRRFATEPARLWKLPYGSLTAGLPANLTVIDPTARWTVSPETIRSKSKNTPLMGMTMTGRAVMTFVDGKAVHDLVS
ncbi:MAG: dihydroorotase [Chloroflexota bacterium]|nr:dihydroorotase [Chloroflexota bacterium]